jgi:hypothetical protein
MTDLSKIRRGSCSSVPGVPVISQKGGVRMKSSSFYKNAGTPGTLEHTALAKHEQLN